MLLLHISDIHFKFPICTTKNDPDRPFRTRMVQDVKERVKTLGPVDAILVTGDIANRADPSEYKEAFKWLMGLAEAGGCKHPQEQIFIVPGNHDIDRSIIAQTPTIKNVQNAITTASDSKREGVLQEQFFDNTTGSALFEPLAAYNDFAKVFGCQVYTPDRLCWEQDLPLEEGMVLRLHGLTSTLLSGAVQESGSQDDLERTLYLSPLQTVLDPDEGVINLVMSHHPPGWLLDRNKVEDAVQERAALHLFGHEHRQRVRREHQYMRFEAGAVNPNRSEPDWEPGYNLINLDVVEDEENKMSLNIEAHILKWQTNPERYVPKLDTDAGNIFRHTVRIANRGTVRSTGISAATVQSLPLDVNVKDEEPTEAVMSNQSTRNLVMRFWNLSSSQRREIAFKLGLIEDADMKIPEPERYGRALLRAGKQGLLEQLGQEIEQREKN